MRKETARRLTEILTEDVIIAMQGRKVVDSFSFVVTELKRAVFKFFKSQVRVRVGPGLTRRFKDREDMTKTYYLCGCVYHSIQQIVQRRNVKKVDVDRQLVCLRGFCVNADTAAKQNLPTRHVCMKTGDGLVYASKSYYQVFSKMEDFFYCTVSYSYTASCMPHTSPSHTPQVTMRTNFAFPDVDIIKEIGEVILNDASIRSEFLELLPSPADRLAFGQDLFEEFVKRLKTLHGTELAAQLTESLASQKRAKDAHKHNRPVQVNAKHEQLRAAKKKRKLMRTQHKRVDVDLTTVSVPVQHTPAGDIGACACLWCVCMCACVMRICVHVCMCGACVADDIAVPVAVCGACACAHVVCVCMCVILFVHV